MKFPDFYEWIFISLFLLVFIFGIVGNILVFYAVWSNVQLRNATNFFLVNLSIADFMVLLICLPPTVIHDVAQTWFLGEILCKLISYLQVSISLFSNLMVFTIMSIKLIYKNGKHMFLVFKITQDN
jgi:hypothetical protein